MTDVAILSSTARVPRRLLPAALVTPIGFVIIAGLNAFLLWAILLSGGLVRLTSSGLGCPAVPRRRPAPDDRAPHHRVH
jgi:hypothetical protein